MAWDRSTAESRSSPAQAAASAVSTRCCSPREGARVVVNDLGGANDGTGTDLTPAQQVVEEIKALGGEAIVNGDDVADWEGAQRLINAAIETFGDLDILVNNAGILRDRVLVNMTEEEWDAVISRAPEGSLRADALGRRVLARAAQGRARASRATWCTRRSTSGLFANPGQSNYGAAKTGIATFSQIVAKELIRYDVKSNTRRPGCADPPDAGDARARGDHGARRRQLRPVGSGEHLAARRLPGQRGVPVHRRDVLRAGRQRDPDRELVARCLGGPRLDVVGRRTRRGIGTPVAQLAPRSSPLCG